MPYIKTILHKIMIEKTNIMNEVAYSHDKSVGGAFFLKQKDANEFFGNYIEGLVERVSSNDLNEYTVHGSINDRDFTVEYTPKSGGPTVVEHIYYEEDYLMIR